MTPQGSIEGAPRDPSAESVGKVIRDLRKAQTQRMTQAVLAEAAGYQDASGNVSISNIERGKALPSPERRGDIAKALGTTWLAIEAEAQRIDAATDSDDASSSLTTIKQIIVGKQKVQNEARASKLQGDLADLRERHRIHVERLQGSIARSREEFTDPFFFLLSGISGLDEASLDPVATGLDLEAGGDVARALTQNRIQVSRTIVDMVGTTAAFGAAGAGLGVAAAFTTYAAVGAFATASTGTAIASLAGASATSATLAWLGGGSLAAGGAGVAGGTAVLSGILAVPAIVAVLTVLVWKGRKIRKQSADEARTIAEAEQELADIENSLTQAWTWADDITQIHEEATLEGVHRLGKLQQVVWELGETQASSQTSDEHPPSSVPFQQIDRKAPGITQKCLKIATILLTLQALPIWSRISELDSEGISPGGYGGSEMGEGAVSTSGGIPEEQRDLLRSADTWNSASIQAAEHDIHVLAEERRRQVSR